MTACSKPGSLTTLRLHVNVGLPTGPAIPLRRRPLLALLLLVSACGGEGAAHRSGLDYYLSADPASLDPAVSSDVQSGEVMALLFDNLVQFDSEAQLHPGLASRWELDRSGTVYTFHLRKGPTFHDGHPIGAAEIRIDECDDGPVVRPDAAAAQRRGSAEHPDLVDHAGAGIGESGSQEDGGSAQASPSVGAAVPGGGGRRAYRKMVPMILTAAPTVPRS